MKSCYFSFFCLLSCLMFIYQCSGQKAPIRLTDDFNKNWKFHLGDVTNGQETSFDDKDWRSLNLPHDWSVEGQFSKDNPATPGGGALPGGIGWYRKTFTIPETQKDKKAFIDFDGVYCNSEVWINGHYFGKRPYGYSSFRYELTPWLVYGQNKNTMAVKVDNSHQPNSRWYSGSGIYRNVRLVMTDKIFVDHWGTFVTTPEVSEKSATIVIKTSICKSVDGDACVEVKTIFRDFQNNHVADVTSKGILLKDGVTELKETLTIEHPVLWTLEKPCLYTALTQIIRNGKVIDDYETTFGIRTFDFDPARGFSLNGTPVKIKGVCDHHDLGCLGSAVNTRALERQLEILKDMGCNGIRTSHNPPAPELLDLCDRMGFIVMDEAFDMWKKSKTDYDYHLYFDEWHKRDLEDLILRDRNHPSVFIWSIGNEILEQWDSTGVKIARELTAIVKNLDSTRPITSACNDPKPTNFIIKSGALDLIGYNYNINDFADFPNRYPGSKFIATETTSAIATRGHYDMPSDQIHRWPVRWDKPFTEGNADLTCSSYDNCSVPWGSTHEETWRIIKKYNFLSGMFIWTGFDYLGEPTPYPWPARSSYFGIVDLAGFPKDAFYMYQSEWTDKPVLHIFPHWNWKKGDTIDVWAYTNYEQVELFLNDQSLGAKQKSADDLHLSWRVPFVPGVLKAIAVKEGKEPLVRQVRTAGEPAAILLQPDRSHIKADGIDLSFVTVKIVDAQGVLVPSADNLVTFEVQGPATIAGVDNGLQTSLEPFKANYRKAFNGLCLAVVQAAEQPGKILIKATSDNLKQAEVEIVTQ
jgi:beta-galactosidase